MKYLHFFFAFISCVIVGCGNLQQHDFVGKKLYILGADKTVLAEAKHLTEVELFFKKYNEVEIRKTVYYGTTLPDDTVGVRTYSYTYKNGVLDIPEYGLRNLELLESPKLYNNDAKVFLYKSSVLTLSSEEQKDRLKELFGSGAKAGYHLLSNKNIVWNPIAESENVEVVDDRLVSLRKEREKVDQFIENEETNEIYVKLHNQNICYKISGNDWPDGEDLHMTYYVYRENAHIIAIIEEPYSQSGDWYMAMIHYFDADGKTYATKRVYNYFFLDAVEENSVFKTGEAYKSNLIKYFDAQSDLIDQKYQLTNGEGKEIVDPNRDDLDLGEEYQDYGVLNSYLKSKQIDFSNSKVYEAVEKVEDYFFFPRFNTSYIYRHAKLNLYRQVKYEMEGANYVEYASNKSSDDNNTIAKSIRNLVVRDNQILCIYEGKWNILTGNEVLTYDTPQTVLKMPRSQEVKKWTIHLSDVESSEYEVRWVEDYINGSKHKVLRVSQHTFLRGNKTPGYSVNYYMRNTGLYKTSVFDSENKLEGDMFVLLD